jgi:hypothetical protein
VITSRLVNTRDKKLHDWFRQRLRLVIPTHAVCEHHHAPWEFFADVFYERYPQIIGMACRTGGKSLGVAGLNVAEMALKPRCGIVSLAGNFEQAKRGYGYVVEMFREDPGLQSKLSGPPLIRRTDLKNGSHLEILTASERSVHSPHVPKLRIDEVDLVQSEIYQGALSIPISQHGVKSGIAMTSTRFKAYGMMFTLVEEAPDRGIAVRAWCIREILKRCPYRYEVCPMKKCEGFCDGKWCKKAQGYYEIDDVYAKFLSMDVETWQTQWMVQKPSRYGLVYDMLGEHHIVDDDMLPPHLRLDDLKLPGGDIRSDPRIRPAWNNDFDWYGAIDWGYEDPAVALLVAKTRNDDVFVLDELYMKHLSPSEWADRVARRYPMLVARLHDDDWTEHEVAPVYADPSDPAQSREFGFRNMLMVSRPYQIQEGISIVRRFLKPPGDQNPKLFIHQRCKELRREMNQYHLKEGTDIPAPGDDHGPDALRYLMNGIFMPIPTKIETMMTWTPEKSHIQPDLDFDFPGSFDI